MSAPSGRHRVAGLERSSFGRNVRTTKRPTWAPVGARLCAAALALAAMNAACGPTEVTSPAYGYSYGSASSFSGSSSSSAVPVQPLVVVVDTDRVLTATPGQGVGVFSEYRTGGHWHVWWTCDTAISRNACNFEIGAAVAGGVIANVQTEGAAVQSSVTATPRQVSVSTVTTTELDGITFDAAPGQSVQIDAQVNGTRAGQFLFFVQDGIVNGGYTGTLTDPLVLSPSAP